MGFRLMAVLASGEGFLPLKRCAIQMGDDISVNEIGQERAKGREHTEQGLWAGAPPTTQQSAPTHE